MTNIINFPAPKPLHHYSQNPSEGSNYRATRHLDIKDIAKQIKAKLKDRHPCCTFSIRIKRYSGGQSMDISLMAGPWPVVDTGYAQLNEYTFKRCTFEEAEGCNNGTTLSQPMWDVMAYAGYLAGTYNYDDSDCQSDYFSVNFYLHLEVGRWDKPYEMRG